MPPDRRIKVGFAHVDQVVEVSRIVGRTVTGEHKPLDVRLDSFVERARSSIRVLCRGEISALHRRIQLVGRSDHAGNLPGDPGRVACDA